jgi:hypothetical protein
MLEKLEKIFRGGCGKDERRKNRGKKKVLTTL